LALISDIAIYPRVTGVATRLEMGGSSWSQIGYGRTDEIARETALLQLCNDGYNITYTGETCSASSTAIERHFVRIQDYGWYEFCCNRDSDTAKTVCGLIFVGKSDNDLEQRVDKEAILWVSYHNV